jgi:hypothetical protein
VQSGEPLDYFRVGIGEVFGFGEISGHVAQEILDLGDLSALVVRRRSVCCSRGAIRLSGCVILKPMGSQKDEIFIVNFAVAVYIACDDGFADRLAEV